MKRNKTLVRQSTIACIYKTSVIVCRNSLLSINNSISILFYYSWTLCFYVFSFVFLYSSTLLQFAICNDSSNNRLQNITMLKLILIFIATLSTLLKVLYFSPIIVCNMQCLSHNFDFVHEIYQYLQSISSLCIWQYSLHYFAIFI